MPVVSETIRAQVVAQAAFANTAATLPFNDLHHSEHRAVLVLYRVSALYYTIYYVLYYI